MNVDENKLEVARGIIEEKGLPERYLLRIYRKLIDEGYDAAVEEADNIVKTKLEKSIENIVEETAYINENKIEPEGTNEDTSESSKTNEGNQQEESISSANTTEDLKKKKGKKKSKAVKGRIATTFKLSGWEIEKYLPGLIKIKNGKRYVRSGGKDEPFDPNKVYYIKGHGLTDLLKRLASKNKRKKMSPAEKKLALYLLKAASYIPPQLANDLSDVYDAMVILKKKFKEGYGKAVVKGFIQSNANVLGLSSPTRANPERVGNVREMIPSMGTPMRKPSGLSLTGRVVSSSTSDIKTDMKNINNRTDTNITGEGEAVRSKVLETTTTFTTSSTTPSLVSLAPPPSPKTSTFNPLMVRNIKPVQSHKLLVSGRKVSVNTNVLISRRRSSKKKVTVRREPRFVFTPIGISQNIPRLVRIPKPSMKMPSLMLIANSPTKLPSLVSKKTSKKTPKISQKGRLNGSKSTKKSKKMKKGFSISRLLFDPRAI